MKTFYIGLTRKQPAEEVEAMFPQDVEIALGTYVTNSVEASLNVPEGTKPVKQILKVTVEAISVDN